jgi:hypothetical protein
MSDGKNEGTGLMKRGSTYVTGTRLEERRCDTVTICKCVVYALEFE